MMVRKILAVCLSALLLAASGCGGQKGETASSGASSAVSPAPSSGVGSSESKPAEPFVSLSMATAKVGYAVTQGLHVLRTGDGWATCTDLFNLQYAAVDYGNPAVFALDENTVYTALFADSGIKVERSADAGKSWVESVVELRGDDADTGPGRSLALSFAGPSKGFLLISSPPALGLMEKTLYRTEDAGKSWSFVGRSQDPQQGSQKMTGINGYTTGMSFFGSGAGYIACTYHGQTELSVYKSADQGESWSAAAVPMPEGYASYGEGFYADAYPPAVYGANRQSAKMELYFCRDEERIPYVYGTEDGGAAWKIEGKSNLLMRSYSFADDQNGFGLDESGALYATADGGFTWTKRPLPAVSSAVEAAVSPLPDSGGAEPEADPSRFTLQFSGQTPTGVQLKRYVPSGKNLTDSPAQTDEVFLSSTEGWKVRWNNDDWTMDISETKDAGKTWRTLGKNLFIKYQSGVTFLNRQRGYISYGFTPAYGWISLQTTMDGGVTWGKLDLTAPKEYQDCSFYTFPPVFFSDADGLILTHYWAEQTPSLKQLVFVTHDGGKSWKAAADRTSDGDLQWDCVKSDYNSYDDPFDTWRVTFGKQAWQSQNGFTWETVK